MRKVKVFEVIDSGLQKRKAINWLREKHIADGGRYENFPSPSDSVIAPALAKFPLRVYSYTGYLNAWMTEGDSGELYTVAVIEKSDGTVQSELLQCIEFITEKANDDS